VFLNRGEVEGESSRSASGGRRWNFLCPMTAGQLYILMEELKRRVADSGRRAYSGCISRYRGLYETESSSQRVQSRLSV
jgi:hypothetical protein